MSKLTFPFAWDASGSTVDSISMSIPNDMDSVPLDSPISNLTFIRADSISSARSVMSLSRFSGVAFVFPPHPDNSAAAITADIPIAASLFVLFFITFPSRSLKFVKEKSPHYSLVFPQFFIRLYQLV